MTFDDRERHIYRLIEKYGFSDKVLETAASR